MAERTKGPYYVDESPEIARIWARRSGDDDKLMCTLGFGALDQRRADIEFIARAMSAHDDLVAALRWFLEDERFQVAVGGNPNVVDRMLEQAHAALAKAEATS